MGTELEDKTLLSPKAMELLECFSEEWEEIVYQMAKSIATEEGSFGDPQKQIPLIKGKHVSDAAQILFQALENALKTGVLPDLPLEERSRLLETLHDAIVCLGSKSQEQD